MRTVIIITGASDGIGAELARQLAQRHGTRLALALAARNVSLLEQVAQQCRHYGSEVLVAPTDVGIEAQCRTLIELCVRVFGGLDILINNAGMSAHALLQDVRDEDLSWYADLMRVNFWGSVWCTHAALPHLKARKGRIVAVCSLAGLFGVPGRTAYCASKFAMTGFFDALRIETQAQGISVTVAYPGVVATQIRYRGYNASGQPAGRSGLREDGAMPVDECARLILRAMERRQREVVMSLRGKLGRWFKLIAPGRVDSLALRTLKDEVRPR